MHLVCIWLTKLQQQAINLFEDVFLAVVSVLEKTLAM